MTDQKFTLCNNKEGATRNVKIAKQEIKTAIIKVLERKNITPEFVLGYACFTYKRKEYRVKTAMEAKEILGML